MARVLEDVLRNLPADDGLHCSSSGAPWALVRQQDGRTHVYIWALDEPFPTEATLRAMFPLTPTQARVALLLLTRRTNAEIAGILGISRHTAKRHVEAVIGRLGVPTRTAVEARVYAAVGAGSPQRARS